MASGEKQSIRAVKMSMRVRIFLSISSLTDWLPRKLKAAHMAIWLGLLNASDFNEITAASYNLSSGFESEKHNLWGEKFIQCERACDDHRYSFGRIEYCRRFYGFYRAGAGRTSRGIEIVLCK